MSASPASRRAEAHTARPQRGHVFLIGFMGAGKSTVGRMVAKRLGLPFVDLDEVIVEHSGRTIPEMFEAMGEPAFRTLESSVLAGLDVSPPSVVACGGGIVLDEGNRESMARLGTSVYLQVSAEEALSRVGDAEGRPLLRDAGRQEAETLMASREPLYSSVADICVDTRGRSAGDVADEVSTALQEAWT